MRERLFELLRYALWGGKAEGAWNAHDFQEVLELAEKQTVAGLVFDVLKDVQIEEIKDKKPIFEAFGLSENIKQQNGVLNNELAWLVGETRRLGLDCLVVKGQTTGCLYPKPEVRQSGDIDFLMKQPLEARKVFTDVDIPERLLEKDFSIEHKGTTLELHTRLVDFGRKKHQRLWNELTCKEWEKYHYVKVDGVKVRTLSPTMNAAYLFVHLFFHLIREGVSLRQFCDWAMLLHVCRDEIDRQQLLGFMQQMDMINAYKAFGCILVDELGLPEKEFPMVITEKDRRWKRIILNDIFRGGNFGKQNHKAKSAFGFKMETLRMASRNCLRYYRLAPSEMRMMIPKMMRINLRLMRGR